jgi:hypothetical protein
MGLIVKTPGGYRENMNVIRGFLPERRVEPKPGE